MISSDPNHPLLWGQPFGDGACRLHGGSLEASTATATSGHPPSRTRSPGEFLTFLCFLPRRTLQQQ